MLVLPSRCIMQHLKRIGHVVFKKFNTFNRYRTATDDDGKIVIAIGHLSDSGDQKHSTD